MAPTSEKDKDPQKICISRVWIPSTWEWHLFHAGSAPESAVKMNADPCRSGSWLNVKNKKFCKRSKKNNVTFHEIKSKLNIFIPITLIFIRYFLCLVICLFATFFSLFILPLFRPLDPDLDPHSECESGSGSR
jgi:hypothetical protein